ncbi:uncharacterized protein LOC111032734 [Myzus persicae]|uniref:uncharacterized protein LOC111032734 n=1 Tax=Myzus persicae TaxID=13164 RepID=UPI000B939415|nr:uncharacterized protein LOC111032734 [Myzus persicae]
MSENGDDSSDFDVAMGAEFSDESDRSDYGRQDMYSDYNRLFFRPIMYCVPPEMRPYVQKLSADSARIFKDKEVVIRRVPHHPTFQEQTETCMDYRCNKLTSIKCSTCHVFVCIECFDNFHDIDN